LETQLCSMGRKKAAKPVPTSGLHARPASDLFAQVLHDMLHKAPSSLHQHLLHHGIDDTNELQGETLLHIACNPLMEAWTKQSDVLVKQLLQAGADVNCRCTKDGYTPLMLTASADITNCLLDNGADINSAGTDGVTALGAASAKGCLAVVHVLLKRGAHAHILKRGQNAHTPLSAAINNDQEEIAMLLLRQLVLQPDFDSNHPRLGANQPLLCSAVTCAMPRVVELALEHGAAVDIVGPNGPPLRMAADAHQYATVDLLCEGGADVNTPYPDLNCLGIAAKHLDVKMVKQLLKHGADVNAVASGQQYSALQIAAISGPDCDIGRACEIVKLLLAAGATIDPHCERSVLCAVCTRSADADAAQVLQLLLPHCSTAVVNVVDPTTCHSPLSVAVYAGKLQAARALHAAGADAHHKLNQRSMLQCAAISGSVAVVQWLQSLGLDARAAGDDGLLPLHSACTADKAEMVAYLLSLPGAADDLHARATEQQLTALHYAACVEGTDVLQLLLNRGAVVDALDSNGATPLMYAKTAAAVKLLLAAGADSIVVSITGSNLLHYQASCGASAGAVCIALKLGIDPTALDANECPPAHYGGIRGHFALERLLSRAADDYRKKHAAAATATAAAAESGSSTAVAAANSRDSAASAAVTHTDAVASNVSSCAVADEQLHDVTAALSSMAVTADSNAEAADAQQQKQQQQQQSKARRAKQPCASCSKPTTKLCRRCAAVYYCSVECQKVCFADAQHRAQCEATAAEIA
jgi:ankyrin repeat protein